MIKTPMENWILKKIGFSGNIEEAREAIDSYTLLKLKETISYAKDNTLYYSETLKHINVNDINKLEDFRKLPFTTPKELSEKNNSFVAVSQKDVKRIVTLKTSGTTGDSKRVFFTERDLQKTVDFFAVGMSVFVNKEDRVLIFLPGDTYGSVGDLLLKALTNIGIKAYVHGPIFDNYKAAAEIREKNINSIVGIPVQILSLCRYNKELKVEKILLSTDYVPEALVNELKENWSSAVYNHYGMTEMGFGGGVQCQALGGYHMREADLYFEIVNPYTGEPALDNEWGEVVFTTLNREAMPLIRYRTGDISRKIGDRCCCNTILKTYDIVQGRIEKGKCNLKSGVLTLRELDEKLFEIPEIVDFKVEINEKGNKDIIDLKIKKKNNSPNIDDNLKSEIIKKLLEIKIIEKGIKNDDLEVFSINFWENNIISSGTSKRQIYDNRRNK